MAGIERDQTMTAADPSSLESAADETAGPAIPATATPATATPATASPAAASAASDTASRRSDVNNWARPVSRLTTEVGQAPLDTVRGKRAVGALQGFGRLWQKSYRVDLGSSHSAADVVEYWKRHFTELWPRGNAFYAPLTGIAPGEVALLQVGVMGGLRLSTGVVVIYVDEESFTFMTPEGHMFAGWITFSATETAAGTSARVEVLMRAQSPMSELGLTLGGHRQEDRFWQKTLSNLAERLGSAAAAVETQVVCVDRHRQWRRAGNIRHDASFRSALYTAAAPVRWARRSIGRR